ncbi:TetR/AcrR family transcriptional regulator [Streptomyces sp. TRM 70351]|uniref:TetR/AcrR family transcriptional regulator n=1 Tax=Streptomyces sp. TRM 70351 TaxID=3116552 RepID=UPI002E7B81D7|nr:TetR/AcrR family transcriptional regulator [Streptomyces sp. TRM 70351]MEE1927065.1 TetR/AcrR family transcriptional regulator [Streptomyces sp. TRM 70351]
MTEKRRRRVPRQVREQQMIDVAIQVFAKRGYHAASVDEIAELAGISKPMVYLYLDSKEGLFVACVRREAERLAAAFQGAVRGKATPDMRLRAGLAAFFGFVHEHRDSWVVLHRQASELTEAIAAEVTLARRMVMAEVAGLVRDGIAESANPAGLGDEDADFVASALVGAADSLTDWLEAHPDESPERVTLRLMNMAWVGMRNVLEGEVWTADADAAPEAEDAPPGGAAPRARGAVPEPGGRPAAEA